jgi:hypothetical protein
MKLVESSKSLPNQFHQLIRVYETGKWTQTSLSFCSLFNFITWPIAHLNYNYNQEILVIYFCNSKIDYAMAFTKARKLDQNKKYDIIEQTARLLQLHSSSLLNDFNMSFVDEDGATSDNCVEVNTDCQQMPFEERESAKDQPKQKKYMIWIAIPLFIAIFIVVVLVDCLMKAVRVIRIRRKRRTAVRSVVILRPFNLD